MTVVFIGCSVFGFDCNFKYHGYTSVNFDFSYFICYNDNCSGEVSLPVATAAVTSCRSVWALWLLSVLIEL
nr:MAG TPA: hypothetical protein [Caudoviricetes sp.]